MCIGGLTTYVQYTVILSGYAVKLSPGNFVNLKART